MTPHKILKPNIPKWNYVYPFISILVFFQIRLLLKSQIHMMHFVAVCLAIAPVIMFIISTVSLIPDNGIVVLNRDGILIKKIFIFKTFFYWDEIDSFASRYIPSLDKSRGIPAYLTVLYLLEQPKITFWQKLNAVDYDWCFPYERYEGLDAGELAQVLNKWKVESVSETNRGFID